jgi:6-phosphogluconolactonase (cycloisomerase 2 family)
MKAIVKLSCTAALAAAGFAAFAAPASASANHDQLPSRGADHAVFVQTDDPAGNQVVAYHRDEDGRLRLDRSYSTGGVGGVLAGSVVDHLASQGALSYDERNGLLYAVNAGSNTVSVFAVHGDDLTLRQVIRSGGTFPVSVAVHGDRVYVLNAEDGGSIQGYLVVAGRLHAMSTWNRPLGLDPAATPQFTHTPGQVVFTPDGGQLVVTTKAATNAIDVFNLDPVSGPSATPVVNAKVGSVPFGATFDKAGHLAVTETGSNSLVTYRVNRNGSLTQLDAVATGQKATCWVAPAGKFLFTSNAGSATVSGFQSSRGGALTLLGATATDAGTVDASATPDGRYLYVQAGAAGIVNEFRVNDDGSLTSIGSVTVSNAAGAEGIAAS